METKGQTTLRYALFVLVLAIAALSTLCNASELRQALIWLPSGVAIAGITFLGWHAAWAVFAATFLSRYLPGATAGLAAASALGSTCEALAGAWLMRLLAVRRGCDRLRDVTGIYLVAVLAPIASILVAVATRTLLWNGTESVWQGMEGWWRMNAIGILVTLPLAMAWPRLSSCRAWLRPLGQACLWGLGAAAIASGVLLLARPGVPSLVLLGALPVAALIAALHMGSRGAATVGFVSVLLIALPAGYGIGPLQGVVMAERHTVAQMVLVGLAVLAPLFGALLAERDANAARWLQSEGVGKALLRILPDASYRIAPDGTVLDAVLPVHVDGETDTKQAHQGPAAAIGKHITACTAPELSDPLMEQIAKMQRGERTDILEHAGITALGRVDREVRLVQLPNGEMLSVTRDITERKRAERQLTLQAEILEMVASGRRRQDVLLRLVQGIETLIPDARCTIMLAQGNQLAVTCAPSLPQGYLEAIEGLEIAPGNGACGTAAHGGETVVCADTRTHPYTRDFVELIDRFDLATCWSVPIKSSDHGVLGTVAMYHNQQREPQQFEISLTEHAATLVAIAIERERREGLLASIQNNINEGVFRSIPGEGFSYVNEAFATMLGYGSADELRDQWSNQHDERHRDCLEQLSNAATSVGSNKLCITRRDGSEFWALLSTSITFEDEDDELICDGTLTDISSFKRLEDQLRQSQKMEAVGQLAGGVAHDFNNLLTAITGFGEQIRGELTADSHLHGDVHQILEAARRAAALTRQLLAFGRQQVLQPEVLEVQSVIDEIRAMVDRLIGEHIELVIEPCERSVRAMADRGQFEQVLLNLVINSRDAMPNGGKIRISTRVVELPADGHPSDLAPGSYAQMLVQDSGVGMSSEVDARAFEPFFTTKEPGRGTGLGLATVYGILKQSGGTATIDSKVGAGTTVSVYLPFADELPKQTRPVVIPRPQRRTGTVLVVEDEPFVLELAERALTKAGHRVLRARDGRDALERFEQHQHEIELVLTDLIMPNMGGRELANELRQRAPAIDILFMSGYAPDAFADMPEDAHMAFLHKPFTTSQLTEMVGIMLADGSAGPRTESGSPSET